MAYYKYEKFILYSDSRVFDTIHSPGTEAPASGIYRCEGCGKEIITHQGNTLPPQSHHQHGLAEGNIRWRLTVCSQMGI